MKVTAPSTGAIPKSTPNSRTQSAEQAVPKIPVTAVSSDVTNTSASTIDPVPELLDIAPPAIPVPEPRQTGKDMAGSKQD